MKVPFTLSLMSNHHRSGNAEDATRKAMELIRNRSRKVPYTEAPTVNPFKDAPYITQARKTLEKLFNTEG